MSLTLLGTGNASGAGGGGGGGSPITFIGSTSNTATGNTVTYTSAPIASGASDTIVVLVSGENSSVADGTSGITVGGVSLTLYVPGVIRNDSTVVGYSAIFYGVPGAFSTANIVATTTAVVGGSSRVSMMVYRLSGLNATPLSQIGSATAFSTSLAIGSIHTAVGGAVLAVYSGQPNKTITESWTGSGSLVEDFNATDGTGNLQGIGCHVATSASSTTETVTFNLSASAQHSGGVISFGP